MTAPAPSSVTIKPSDFFPSANIDSDSIVLSDGDIVTVNIEAWQFSGTDCIQSISGQGGLSSLSFTQIDSEKYNAGSFDYPVRAYVAKVGAGQGGTGTIRVTVDTGTCADCVFQVIKWANADATTPIVLSAKGTFATNASYGPITIADRAAAGNVRCAFFNTAATFSAASAGSGYTELTETNGNGSGFYCQYGATDTDPSFTSTANNGNNGASGLVYEVAEAAAGDVSYTLTGRSASAACSSGTPAVGVGVGGVSASAALSAGTPAVGVGVGVSGRSASATEQAGSPSGAGAYAVTGAALSAAEQAGSPAAGSAYTPSGASVSAAFSWSALVAGLAHSLPGASLGAAESAGAPSTGSDQQDTLTGRALSVAGLAGLLTPSTSYIVASTQANIAASASPMTAAPSYALGGAALGASFAHGAPLVSLAHSVSGAGLGASAAAGNVTTPGGTTLTGLSVAVAGSAGTPTVAIAYAVQSQALSASASVGALSHSVAISVAGAACSAGAVGGSLGGAIARSVLGASCSVATATGALSPGEAEDVTLTLVGLGLGVQCSAGFLGFVTADPTIPDRLGKVRARNRLGLVRGLYSRAARVSR